MSSPPRFETVFISDVHLGTPDSKAEEAAEFLASIRCKLLVLNGDIVDEWFLTRGGKWFPTHSRFIQEVFHKLNAEGAEVIYVRGNHDNVLEHLLPLKYEKLSVVERFVHQTPQGDYLVIHGDGLDGVAARSRMMVVMGSVTYEVLLRVNRVWNKWRKMRGKEYCSIGSWLKARFKKVTPFLKRYETQVEELARLRGCQGVICGHVHSPEDKDLNGIHYLNSGDWVESLTAIVEHEPGRFELIDYQNFKANGPSMDPAPSPHSPTDHAPVRSPA